MNLTLTQAVDRTKDLSGLLKAARAHEADCAADHAAKQRIAEIAGEAHEKACGHCLALEAEREDLANHIAGLVRTVGDPPPLADEDAPPAEFGSVFAQPTDFQAAALEHAAERVNGAFEEATR